MKIFITNDSKIFLYYLAFIYFGFQCTWCRLFQKHVVGTKFDIYVFIVIKYIKYDVSSEMFCSYK
jgi:hypothetical protein